jgi:hypothetical protein
MREESVSEYPRKKSSVGKSRNRWLDGVEYVKKMGVNGWRKIARNSDAWKLILHEAKVVHGPYGHSRRIPLYSSRMPACARELLYVQVTEALLHSHTSGCSAFVSFTEYMLIYS